MLFWSVVFSGIALLFHVGASIFLTGRPLWASWTGTLLLRFLPGVALCMAWELLRCVIGWVFTAKKANLWWGGAIMTLLFAIPTMLGTGLQIQTPQALLSQLFRFWLPALTTSAALTVLCLYGGVYPVALYSLVNQGLRYFVPEQLSGSRVMILLNCLIPILYLIALDMELSPEESKEKKKKKRKGALAANIALALVLVAVLLFSWGLLPVRPTAIATGSMVPELNVGDLVVISTLDKEIETGDIIQFHRDGLNIIHRVVEITRKDGRTVYLTRGDNNPGNDPGYVVPSDIEGKVLFSVPYLGWITLWLHSGV